MKIEVAMNDLASAAIRGTLAKLSDRTALHAEMGFAVETLVARHMRATKVPQGNRLGAPSTGFWKAAIESITGSADADGAVVSIPHRGAALQYYGGTVSAKSKPYLTIPIHKRAHGKFARELGVKLYRFVSKAGNLILATDPKPQRAASGRPRRERTGPPRYRGGIPMYVLKKAVTIRAHSDVLPGDDELLAGARTAAINYLEAEGK